MTASVFDFKAISARYQQVGNPWVPNTDNTEEPVALKLAKNADSGDIMRRVARVMINRPARTVDHS